MISKIISKNYFYNAMFLNNIITSLKNIDTYTTDKYPVTMEITDENDRLNEIVYGQTGETRLEFHTKAVEFLPEYQIYCSLYGPPKEFDSFDTNKLDDIKLVLKRNPALTYRDFMIKFGLTVENIHFQNKFSSE